MTCDLSRLPTLAPEAFEGPRRDREMVAAASIGGDPSAFIALLDGCAELRVALPDGAGRAGAVADARLAHSVGITPPAVISGRSARESEGQPHTDLPAEPADMQHQGAPDEPAAPLRAEARNAPPGSPGRPDRDPAVMPQVLPESADAPGEHRATQESPRHRAAVLSDQQRLRVAAPDEASADTTRPAEPARSAPPRMPSRAADLPLRTAAPVGSATPGPADSPGEGASRPMRMSEQSHQPIARGREVVTAPHHDGLSADGEAAPLGRPQPMATRQISDPRGTTRSDVLTAPPPMTSPKPAIERQPDSGAPSEQAAPPRRSSRHMPVIAPIGATDRAAIAESEPIAVRAPQGPRPAHAPPASLLDGSSESPMLRPQLLTPTDIPDVPRLWLLASEGADAAQVPDGGALGPAEARLREPVQAGSDPQHTTTRAAPAAPDHLPDIPHARERQRASDSTRISDRARLAPIAVEAALPQVTPGGRAAIIARTEPVITLREPVRIPMGELTADRPQRLVLEVDPPALGRCELELSLHDGRVRATVIAERVETALALRAVEGHVREQLAARDLQIAEFDVRTGAQTLGHDGPGREAARDGERWSRPDSHPPRMETGSTADEAFDAPERVRTHNGAIDLMA